MAPSGGLLPARHRRCITLSGILSALSRLVIFMSLQSVDTDGAAIAKGRYYMDYEPDCFYQGILDLQRDQVTYVTVYAQSARSSALTCILQFSPKESGDTLRIWFERDAFIGDCDVSLTVSMTDNARVWDVLDNFEMGCRSGQKPPEMEAVNGRGRLHFKRTNLAATSYGFTVGVQARRSQDPAGSGDSSTSDVAMIVGIVAAAVVAVVLLLVLCVCCYRNRKNSNNDFRVQANTPVQYQANLAFQNGKMNPDSIGGSPSSEKRLLSKTGSQDYEAEENNGGKPKSALDRFGPTPARRSDRMTTNQKRAYDNEKSAPQDDPVLEDLRNNPKFHKSLGAGGVRSNDDRDRGTGSESSTSYNSNGVALPPKLPPVPRSPQRSPSPQRKGEKIAGIFRARPSSSSSEIARQLEGEPVDLTDSEFVPSPRKDEKADTRHVLRPNRGGGGSGERRPTLAEERRRAREKEEDGSDGERRGRNRERFRRDEEVEEKEKEAQRERKRREEERERQRRMEEEEEEREEEERRRKKKEREREKRRQEEEDEEEEREREKEKERKERRRREKEREREDDRLEGRFKKSASGRRSKGKGPRMGRSKSTSNALEEMEEQYQRSRSKSPSSVRSLNFIEDDDDDDDLDSNYMPFKRAGSKTSLYASRSSLYGRRRKNSMGETISLSSYAITNDDLDSRYGDFDRRGLSLSRRDQRDKMFKSTGELEMHGATAQVVRECATQTDSAKSVYVYGRKTLAKSRPGKMYSRGCQTGRTRRDSTGSARSGRSSRMRKSKSTESLRKRSRSRHLDESYDSSDDRLSHRSRSRKNLDDSYDSDNRSRRHRSRSRGLDYSDDEESRRGRKSKKHHRSKSRGLEDEDDDDYDKRSSRGKPRARPRKSTGAASVDLSESDDGRSLAASSIAASAYAPPHPSTTNPYAPNPYGAQYVPVMFPPPAGMAAPYHTGPPGGPPVPPPTHNPAAGPKPPIAPKPKKSKWDELVAMTDKEKSRHHHRADSPTESMLTSVYSHPAATNGQHQHPNHQQNYYAPPSYTTAQNYNYPPKDPNSTISTAYPDSSGMPLSGRGGRRYAPSESEI